MNYVVIDGDSILYRCGFAAQHKVYECDGLDFSSKKELSAYEKLPRDAPFEYTSRIDVEPVENALSNVKHTIMAILSDTEAADYTIYISSNTPTFRDKLATIKPYKGNRIANDKPIHYDACKQYIMDVWGALECFGVEADDMVAIKGSEGIIVSNDKDLLQVPGPHYNWTKPEEGVFEISDAEALHYKYIQILAGDATDNIQGIPGLGEKGASKLLTHMFGATEAEYDEMCRLYYMERLGDEVGPHAYEETKSLITIITKETDIERETG